MCRPTTRLRFASILLAALTVVGTACEPWNLDTLRLLGPAVLNFPRPVVISHGIPYADRDGEILRFDLYRPADAGSALPLVVVVHGGSWRSGTREQLEEYAYDLAANGFVAAAIDYRLVNEQTVFPAPVVDVMTAVVFLRDHAGEYAIDPERIALFGGSAGGHLALMAGLPDDASTFDSALPAAWTGTVKAIVDVSGPTDFTVDPAEFSDSQIRTVERFLGGELDAPEFDQTRHAASPVTYVRDSGPAVLIIHGDADDLVPVSQAHRLDQALQSAAQPHEMMIVPGMNHIQAFIWAGPWGQQIRLRVLSFLANHL